MIADKGQRKFNEAVRAIRPIIGLTSVGLALLAIFLLIVSRPATAIGSVVDSNNAPSVGLTLVLADSGGEDHKAITGENDEFEIKNIADETYRGLWIWQTDIVLDSEAQSNFLGFALRKGISGIYLNAYDLLPNYAGDLKDFVAVANQIGLEVELLSGDPAWALAPNHSLALGFAQQAITFTQSITGEARPIGLHLDIEPYLLPEWNSDRTSTITQYLDLLTEVKQELAASGTGLILTVDMPFWFDTITATYQSVTKPLHQHVQDIADRVVILAYRDFAEGIDGIIYHTENEMKYAESIGKKVVIGVETNKSEPEKVTFYEEGETVMEHELALVEQHYQSSSAFRGFAIHDYSGYRTLEAIRYIYLPIVLKSHPAG